MMFPKAITWIETLENLDIVRRGEPVPIRNTTAEDLSQAVSRINDPARAALAKLWDWPGQGMIFAEFWEECPEVKWSGHQGLCFGTGRTDLFVKTEAAILGLALDRTEQRVVETSFAGHDIAEFVGMFRTFLGNILLSRESAGIAAALRDHAPALSQRDSEQGMVNYWWGVTEALAYEELVLGKDFLYYRDRAKEGRASPREHRSQAI